MMDLAYVLRRTWRITWGHKTTWLFGLLIAVGSAGTRLVPAARQLPFNLTQKPAPLTTLTAGHLLIGLVVSLGIAALGALGRGGLVHQVHMAELHGSAPVGEAWVAAKGHWWPIWGLWLLFRLPLLLPIAVGTAPAWVALARAVAPSEPETAVEAALAAFLLQFTCLAPAGCLSMILSTPLRVIQRLAIRAYVLEGLAIRPAVGRAWSVLKEHAGELALVWLITSSVGAAWLILLLLPLGVIQTAFGAAMAPLIFKSRWVEIILRVGVSGGLWLIGLAGGMPMETFTGTLWTLAYRELNQMGLTGEA